MIKKVEVSGEEFGTGRLIVYMNNEAGSNEMSVMPVSSNVVKLGRAG